MRIEVRDAEQLPIVTIPVLVAEHKTMQVFRWIDQTIKRIAILRVGYGSFVEVDVGSEQSRPCKVVGDLKGRNM